MISLERGKVSFIYGVRTLPSQTHTPRRSGRWGFQLFADVRVVLARRIYSQLVFANGCCQLSALLYRLLYVGFEGGLDMRCSVVFVPALPVLEMALFYL